MYIKELLEVKVKIIIQRINELCNIFILVLQKSKSKEINSLEMIKQQYIKMYNEAIKEQQYEKYEEIENIIIEKISKIELQLQEYIYNTIENCEQIIASGIIEIRKSNNYQNLQNMQQELDKTSALKELLRWYSPYISEAKRKELENNIIHLKFDILFRKQIQELIYENGSINNHLSQYNNENEKEIFRKLLQQKINSIKEYTRNSKNVDEQIAEDELFEISIEEILSDSNLLDRLIIIDIKQNPYNYINLLKAKIFNAHLCNIGNNPFEEEEYISKKNLHELKYYGYERGMRANKVNYSLLQAILTNIITDENISIIKCQNLYKRFGFECMPILINIGQKIVKMIFDDVRTSREFEDFSKQLKTVEKAQQRRYCKIDFRGLIYEFDNQQKDLKDLFNQILDERKINSNYKIQKNKLTLKRRKEPNKKDFLEKRKEEIKQKGIISTDIDIIILLIKDIIHHYNIELQQLYQILEQMPQQEDEKEIWSNNFTIEKFGNWYYDLQYKCEIEEYEEKIEHEKEKINWLEEIRNKKLTLQEIRKLLIKKCSVSLK